MKNIFIFILLIFILDSNAQDGQKVFFNDFNFIIHLTRNKLFREAESERSKLFSNPLLGQKYRDSVNYFLGLTYHEDHQDELARKSLLQVSDETFFYYKAHYLAAMIDADKGMPDSSISIVKIITPNTNETLNELKTFELAGLHLLKNNHPYFDSVYNSNAFKNTLLKDEIENLKKYSENGKRIKRKSPLMAGVLSAIVPGLGKVYAGNNGQALATFLTCGLMGGVAAENYFNLGITHPQTLFFTALFGVFYVGNIWGSAVSVQVVKIEKQLENKHNILVGLKLPIDKFFN
jgi:hypothetical protein